MLSHSPPANFLCQLKVFELIQRCSAEVCARVLLLGTLPVGLSTVVTWAVLLVVLDCHSACLSAGTRPNVLLVLCDNLNTDIGPYSASGASTPAMTRLASNGVCFDRAYCQHSQGGPSRASLLSGLYPEATGVIRDNMHVREEAPGVVTLPQFFKEAGYWTASAGKVFHDSTHDYDTIAWDRVVRFPTDHLPVLVAAHRDFVSEYGPIHERRHRQWRQVMDRLGPVTYSEEDRPGYGPSGLPDDRHADGRNAREVARWLMENPFGDGPFFIAFGLHKPHVPFVVPDKYFEIYANRSFPPAPAQEEEWTNRPAAAEVKRYAQFGFKRRQHNEALRAKYVQAYYASVSFADAQIDIVLQALERSGHADNTIVILTSDVGYHLGDHWLWGKDTLFERCLRVPLIVATPSCPSPGSHSESIANLIDLFPTLAELCGITPPGNAQGSSFAGKLSGEQDHTEGWAYSVAIRPSTLGQPNALGRSLRTARWRYTEWKDASQAELYDHEKDPNEFVNLAGNIELAEVQRQLHQQLMELKNRATRASSPDTSVAD